MYAPLSSAVIFALLFVYVELRVAPEPILAPFLLTERIPVLVGVSNFCVATCNFAVMYNFPTWFQTVLLTSAGEAGACGLSSAGTRLGGDGRHSVRPTLSLCAGAHLIPNGISVSCGSLFAG